MIITSYVSEGFNGKIVQVEVDLRRGIPGVNIVGLPDGAVKEARERVRVSIRNSGFNFPDERILINLAPAGIKKEGASFDLPIAIAVLYASKQVLSINKDKIMILGELLLSGIVRPVNGVLPAVAAGINSGIKVFFVPKENIKEAESLNQGNIYGIGSLKEASETLYLLTHGRFLSKRIKQVETTDTVATAGDFSEIRGHSILKRALEVGGAGRHHILLFGPPGSGKTMSAKRFATILPDLKPEDSITVTKIHSIYGILPENGGLVTKTPFRSPHHSATREGLIGGGKILKPGEVSLAHKGVLFLDEAPEFKQVVLTDLREPLENGDVNIARAGTNCWFPSDFQLILTANPCPCGNLGRDEAVCLCSKSELRKYWKKLGGPLLDRIDIRIPVHPVPAEEILNDTGESSSEIRNRVKYAVEIQEKRYSDQSFSRNSKIPAGLLPEYCRLDKKLTSVFTEVIKKLSLSSRAVHSVLKLSRTIADLENREMISKEHLFEAVQHRRYGDSDFFWSCG